MCSIGAAYPRRSGDKRACSASSRAPSACPRRSTRPGRNHDRRRTTREPRRSPVTQYLLTVHGPAEIDEFGNYGSREEMEQALATTRTFNDQLRADGHWVFAGG